VAKQTKESNATYIGLWYEQLLRLIWLLSHCVRALSLTMQAQKLKTSISTVGRLIVSDYRLYVITDDAGEKLMGILKIGKKHLYVVVRMDS
jgi:hypothetical protein